MNKVFVIGLSKTGTTSLHAALEVMGLRSIHNPEAMLSIEGGELRISPALADRYDALSDLPIAAFYRDLDRAFPGSRFILTTRDVEGWLISCRNHFDPAVFHPNAVVGKLVERVYGTRHFDESKFRAAIDAHNRGALEYFAQRPADLLVCDVADSAKWPPLASFLELPVPSVPYPHENRATRIPGPLKRALRWIRAGIRGR